MIFYTNKIFSLKLFLHFQNLALNYNKENYKNFVSHINFIHFLIIFTYNQKFRILLF